MTVQASSTNERRPGGAKRASRRRSAAVVLGAGLFLTACSSGPGSEQDLVDVLLQDGNFTEDQATCLAAEVFAEYGEDEEALGRLSSANTLDDVVGAEGVDGFTEFFGTAVAGCSPSGPTEG